MDGKIIKDLHGHTFKVLSWSVISKENMFPLIHTGEQCSFQADNELKLDFILAEYKGKYKLSMYTPNHFHISANLELLNYNPKTDIRSLEYGKK